MNFLNLKKAICAVGILFAALYTQQAVAWGYLYCVPDPWSSENWEWAVITDPNKKLGSEFNDLAYEYLDSDHKRYMVIRGPERYHRDNLNYWSINVPKRTPLMTKEESTAFCQKLKSFCPASKPYALASQSEYGQAHRIWIPRQVSPQQPNDHVYEVCS